jgi:hypothetical protein
MLLPLSLTSPLTTLPHALLRSQAGACASLILEATRETDRRGEYTRVLLLALCRVCVCVCVCVCCLFIMCFRFVSRVLSLYDVSSLCVVCVVLLLFYFVCLSHNPHNPTSALTTLTTPPLLLPSQPHLCSHLCFTTLATLTTCISLET